MFASGSLTWPDNGIVLNEQHNRRAPIIRFTPEVREDEVIVDVMLPDTQRGRDAAIMVRNGTMQGLSIEFRSVIEETRAGIRYIKQALLGGAGLVDSASHGNSVEVREKSRHRRPRVWL